MLSRTLRTRPARAFDIVFIDPPFAVAPEMIATCAERLTHGWLRSGARVYIEAPRSLRNPPVPAHWVLEKHGLAGEVNYQLFQVAPAPG